MKKLTEPNKLKLDLPYSLEELEMVIRSSKLNKAPGPDGFSNEFFKFFMDKLKIWILRYFAESIQDGKLSETTIEVIITCIPKSGKLRNDLKNLRPLTLLNKVYKFLFCHDS